MPEQSTPSAYFNLEYLRKEAKAVLKQCRARDPEAVGRLRASLPRLSELDDEHVAAEIQLSDIHFALAREHGYANWATLKQSMHQSVESADFSRPGSDGSLPEDYVPWRWGVSYTVRPELLSPLAYGEKYLVTASVLWKRPNDETFRGYADLYEQASAIAYARTAMLRCARGGSLHTRLLNHTWFRHEPTHLVRAAVSLEVACLKEGEAKLEGQSRPTREALAAPGGMTKEQAGLLPKRTWHEIYSVGDLRDATDNAGILGFSYGEFVHSADALDYRPYIERAEAMTRFHLRLVGKDNARVVRREWFCATAPDIAVVHIYAQP